MLKRLIALLALISFVPLHAAPAAAPAAKAAAKPREPGVEVNNRFIPQSWLRVLVEQETRRGIKDERLGEVLLQQLVRVQTIASQAASKGVDKTEKYRVLTAIRAEELLAQLYLENFEDSLKYTDAQIAQKYEDMKKNTGDSEYKISHILTDSEAKATDIIRRINLGERFDAVARIYSMDNNTRERGGALEWDVISSFAPNIADAVRQASAVPGKLHPKPVQSNFGWHVLKVDETRPTKILPLAEARPRVEATLKREAVELHLKELREKAKIEVRQ